MRKRLWLSLQEIDPYLLFGKQVRVQLQRISLMHNWNYFTNKVQQEDRSKSSPLLGQYNLIVESEIKTTNTPRKIPVILCHLSLL